MTKSSEPPNQNLRTQAEENVAKAPLEDHPLTPDHLQRLVADLQIHQIELELQNEELRNTQEQLELSQARYFELYDLAPIGYLTLNKNLLIDECNLAAAAMFKTSRSELKKEPISMVLKKEHQKMLYDQLTEARSSDMPQEIELCCVGRDREVFWAHIQICTAQDGYRLTLNDISPRIQAEEDQRQLSEQLQQSQKMEVVGRLAGGIAHDFNNMLGVILGHTDMALQSMAPTGKLLASLEQIRKAAQQSADLTQQLLAFARKQTIVPKVLNINAVTAELLPMLERLIGENIKLTFSPAADLWLVKADSSQILQMLTNLCVNARSAIDGIGTIHIQTENRRVEHQLLTKPPFIEVPVALEPGEYVQLSLKDNGKGIKEDQITHIFEPFFTTGDHGGTGLGLSTVLGAVRQNNGYIKVDSKPGYGTEFKILLPRDVSGVLPAKKPEQAAKDYQPNKTVLLVEDNEDLLDVEAAMLTQLGYQVLKAKNPAIAEELAIEHAGHIDLLLSDVIMPLMDGRELSTKLLAICPEMKVIFMSGYTADVLAAQGIFNDNVSFLQKPFTLAGLKTELQQLIH